ncbi:vam6/Vps39-like protein [Xenia sp. Carnegie-2017]|uniref:vam6/Vps39-like protein n=1 Tax=Xenia sp. Carnegie-2017 TaxID=2897299 RepID=UPI001F03E672|nr:vam6/Vps39-like protein [Xenia sp. Carnegie-2017]
MHDAFEHASILERLPLTIESIATYENHLLVGTRPGHLLVYNIKDGSGDKRFEVQLKRSNKLFSKKPILQMVVVCEFNLLISLSDNVVSVHDLESFTLKYVLNKTRGATVFAVDVQKHKKSTVFDPTPTFTLRMCVSVRKRLLLFVWKNGQFEDLEEELGIPDVAKTVAWAGDSVCVGFRKDYYLIKINTGSLKDLFTTGKNMEPSISVLKDGNLLLGRDEVTVFIDSDGKPAKRKAPVWTDVPLAVEFHEPYMIGILPKFLEVRTVEPRALVQSIELSKPRFIAHDKFIYVASSSHVWRLVPAPLPMQIQQLLNEKQFDLALLLASKIDEDEKEKIKRTQTIQYQHAFELFCQKRFEESFRIFGELDTDPPEVIGLFKDLLPENFREHFEYPSSPPSFSGSERERGYNALIQYLLKKRNMLLKNADDSNSNHDSAENAAKMKKTLRQIIDTTLLKCYVHTNDALVGPFLRLDNHCHPVECEKELYRHKKYDELLILYQTKNNHKKALDLLLKKAQKPGASWEGPSKTVEYLQRLGKENLPFIIDYSRWVLKSRPEYGLKIFTEDIPEVEGLPRDQIVSHIEQNAPHLVIPYLEKVIQIFCEQSSDLHNKLVNCYRERITELMISYKNELPEGEPLPRAGMEPGELGELRATLLSFLRDSRFYQPQNLLIHFDDSFFEERALLLGRLGRHEEALAIYIFVLNDIEMASTYCKQTYTEEWEDSKDVYACLLHMYLSPPDPSILGAKTADLKANVEAALNVLKEHYDKINPIKALELLPLTIEVQEIFPFLEKILEEKSSKKKTNQVLKSLLFAEHLQIQERRMYYHTGNVIVNDERACRVCHKKIGTSAFACYPSGEILHYYCYETPKNGNK